MMLAYSLAAALVLPTASAGPWILTCNVQPAAGSALSMEPQRIFRIAPRLLQQWRPADKRFGPNLCASYSCVADKNRLEGTVSSASLSLTIRLDLASGRAVWSTQGASGLRASSGDCTVRPEAGATGAVAEGPA